MTAIFVLLMIIGFGGILGVPFRVVQLTRVNIRAIYGRLGGLGKLVVTMGLVALALSALAWIGVAYVAVMVFTDDTTFRIWAGSELGMTTSVLGILYLTAEVLLLPVRKREHQSAPLVST